MAKSSTLSPAYKAARRWGREHDLITIPLTISGAGPDKEIQPKVRYAHLNGHGFNEGLFAELWSRFKKVPGLGIYSDRLIEIEADTREGDDALVELGLRDIDTPTFKSRRGHKFLFVAPDFDLAVNTPADGLLGDGTEVLQKLFVVPPTPGYRWLKGKSLDDVEPAPLPENVVELLRPSKRRRRTAKPTSGVFKAKGRNNALTSHAGILRRQGASRAEILTALRSMNEEQCRPPLSEKDLKTIAKSVAQYPPNDERHWTDTGNAQRLVAMHGDRIRYCPAHKAWYVWNGQIWARDNTLEIMRIAKATVRTMYREASEIADLELRSKAAGWSIRSESQSRLEAMVKNAQSEVVIEPTALDSDRYLFCVENGTLNLKTGKLQPHDPADFITLMSPEPYDPKAKDDRWEEVLDRFVRPDNGKEDFLRRAAFASITGTTEKAFINLFDEMQGDTGKTTFVESLLAAVGPYGEVVNAESFLANRSGGRERIRADLAACYGKRMVVSSEIPAGRNLDAELMKKLTQGFGDFQYERKYENPWKGRVTFTIWLDGNKVAKARLEDHPVFKRWKLTPFKHRIKVKPDPRWLEKAAGDVAYRTSVLAWIVKGRKAWLKKGIGTAPAIEKATEQVRASMDPLAGFWREECRFGTDRKGDRYFATTAELRDRLAMWADEPGRHVINERDFLELLKAKGVIRGGRRIDGKYTKVWIGVKLRKPRGNVRHVR